MNYELKKIELHNDIEPLQLGDRCELGFCIGRGIVSEHLWVRVYARSQNGQVYFGCLEKDAARTDLVADMTIKFKPEHVVRVRRRGW